MDHGINYVLNETLILTQEKKEAGDSLVDPLSLCSTSVMFCFIQCVVMEKSNPHQSEELN